MIRLFHDTISTVQVIKFRISCAEDRE